MDVPITRNQTISVKQCRVRWDNLNFLFYEPAKLNFSKIREKTLSKDQNVIIKMSLFQAQTIDGTIENYVTKNGLLQWYTCTKYWTK